MRMLLNWNGDGKFDAKDMVAFLNVFFVAFGAVAAGYVIADLPSVTDWFLTIPGQILVCLSISAGILGIAKGTSSVAKIVLSASILFGILQAVRVVGHHVTGGK